VWKLVKRKPLKAKTLKAKTTLKAKKPLKAVSKPKKRKTLQQKTAQELIKEADKWFSRYIRIRDAEYEDGAWVGECITCDRKLLVIDANDKWIASSQNGHFITRGIHSLRFEELNCNLQCAHCNAWRDKEDMLERYRKALEKKYGAGTNKELKRLSQLENAHKRLPKQELLQIITDAKEYIKHCQTFPQNYSR